MGVSAWQANPRRNYTPSLKAKVELAAVRARRRWRSWGQQVDTCLTQQGSRLIAGMSRKRERRLGPPHMDIDRVMIKVVH